MIVGRIPAAEKKLALTFDDGPHPEYTLRILDMLDRYRARATFFVIGEQLERYRHVAERIAAAGHELGNHTYTHPRLPETEPETQRDELARTDRLIRGVAGRSPIVFRPPFLAYDERVLALAASFGYATIGAANVEAADWTQPGVSFILDKTRPHLRPGAVLLFHDGGGDRSQTVEAVGALLPELVRQGYEAVTVGELLASIDSGPFSTHNNVK